jgi:hypothetical protein
MTRRLILLMAMLAACVGVATTSRAHEKFRIIGTVAKVDAKDLEIKQTKDGKIIGMDMTPGTVVMRDGKKVAAAQLKVGLYVVADAFGDSLEELEALEVKIVPAPAK